MATFVNPFISSHVDTLWQSLIGEFGRQVNYVPFADPASAATITVIWKEGSSDEEVSPGRYSHILVRNADLAALPESEDEVQSNGFSYSVVRIEAYAYNYSTLVIHKEGPVL